MPFPDLQLVGDVLKAPNASVPNAAEATGFPDDGNNTFLLPFVDAGVDPVLVTPGRLKIHWDPDPSRSAGGSSNPGVDDVRFVALSADKRFLTLNFSNPGGSGDARVNVQLDHTVVGVAAELTPLVLGSGGGTGGAAPPPSFSASLAGPTPSGPFEIGENLVNPTFNASYTPAGTETFAELEDDQGNPAQNVLSLPNPLIMPFTYQRVVIGDQVVWTLTANDGGPNVTDQVSATWLPRVFWGVDASAALATEADIEGLANSALQSNKALNFTFTAANEYVYFGFPVAFPAVATDFQIGPFPGGFIQQVASVAVTANTAGAPVLNYQLWRSTNALDTTVTGPQTLVVSA